MDLDELFRAALEGKSPRAREQLARTLRAELVARLRRLADPHDVQDAVQEAILTVLRRLPEVDLPNAGALRAYTYTVGRNLLRRNASRGMLSLQHRPLSAIEQQSIACETGLATTLLQREQLEILARLLEQLATRYRRPLELRLAGIEVQEIAQIEGISAKGARVRLTRACAKINALWRRERKTSLGLWM
ncbi:MAG: sigma-70 family RNA polymerase sigma factor [Deltaproteobacteria bacterium]|nr:sigma-70 family RNA polymerase sigma factor [Deltaproteobacteria bacterium]